MRRRPKTLRPGSFGPSASVEADAQIAFSAAASGDFAPIASLAFESIRGGDAGSLASILSASGSGLWLLPGFSRASLRSLESCGSLGGGECFRLWLQSAQEFAPSICEAFGTSPRSRALAFSSLSRASWWAWAGDGESAAFSEAAISVIRESSPSDGAQILFRFLCEWLSPSHPFAPRFSRAASSVASALAGHPSWLLEIGPVGQILPLALMARLGFLRSSSILLSAVGDRALWELRDPQGMGVPHWSAKTLDEEGWAFSFLDPAASLRIPSDPVALLPLLAEGASRHLAGERRPIPAELVAAKLSRMIRAALDSGVSFSDLAGDGPDLWSLLPLEATHLSARDALARALPEGSGSDRSGRGL